MILAWLLLILLVGGVLAWLAGRLHPLAARWVALLCTVAVLIIAIALWLRYPKAVAPAGHGPWLLNFNLPWVPQFGINIHLAMDGLSLLLILLTGFIGVLSVFASWHSIHARVGFYHFNLLWTLAGITGVFLAVDLFLFYFMWEMMLIPLYFIIDIWGHERRHYAAVKFFIFTQTGGLFLLLAILALYFLNGGNTFDYARLIGTAVPPALAIWLLLGFFIAFIVKLPAVPLHTWLPDAHTQAPVAGSIILAGLVLKVGAYGLLRLTVPLFPQASHAFASIAMTLAVISILYGAILAFGQTDVKRLVAYTSVSHMGFVLLGIFAWNTIALTGAVVVIIAHGISTGLLFLIVGIINERLHTRSMDEMGGFWTPAPKLGGAGLFFALASLGLPGLANFVGEFLVLLGTFTVPGYRIFAIIAAAGLILSAIYSLWFVQRVFFGPVDPERQIGDLTPLEMAMIVPSIAVALWLGLYPLPVLDTAEPALAALQRLARPRAANRIDLPPPAPIAEGTASRKAAKAQEGGADEIQ